MREEQWKALDAWIKAEQGNRATYDTAEQAGTTGGGTWLTDSLRGIAEREAQEAMRKGGMFAAVAPDDPQAPGTGGLLAGPPRKTGLITADGRPRWELPLPADNALLGATQAQQRQLAEKKAAELNRAADEALDNALPKGIPTADGAGLMQNRPPKAAQIPTAEGLAAVLAGRDMTPQERVEWDYAGLPERERKMSRGEFEALKETYPELARYDFATGADPTAEGFRGFVAGERIRQRFDEAENEQREQEKAQKAREENPETTRDAELGYKAAEVLYDRIGRYEADGTRQNLERLSEALENPYVKREFDEMAGSREAVTQARAEFDEEYRKRLPGWQAEQIRATAQDYENNPVAFGLKQAKPSAPFVDEYRPQERRDFDLAGRLLDGAEYAAGTVSQAEQDVADFRNESSGKSAAGRFLHGLKPANIENVLSLGWIEAADLLRIAQINEKASKGEALTDGEKAAAGAYLVSMDAASRLEMLGGATGWGTVGEAVGDNAAFIANMAAFGGFGSAAQQAAKRLVSKAARAVAVRAAIAAGESAGKAGAMAAAKRGLGKAAEAAVKNRLVRGTGKAAEAVIASTAGGAAMAPTSPITYTEFGRRENDEFTVGVDDLGNYFARKTDPASVWENLYKAGTTSTMENASELLGLDLAKGVGAIGRRAEKSIGKTKAGRALEMIRSRIGDMPALKRWDNYMGETFKWYGTPVELMTEEYSAFLEPLATGEPERIRENFSSAAQWDLALSVIGMGAAFNAARLPVAVYDHAQYRRRAGTLLGKIENPDIRKQVSRAMQQTTRSGQATELGKVDWENASLRDMAAATDYVAHKTQGQATQAIRDAMREQTEAKAAVERFEKLKNRDTGKAEEVTDTQGNRFFLAGGTIEKSGEETADGTVFVIDPVSEEVSQKSVDELRMVKTTSYEEFEQEALERIRTASEAQAEAEALEDIMDDAAAAGDDPTARAAEYMGINLDALEGRTVTLASGEQAFISSVAPNPTSRWMEIDAVPLNPETGSTRVDEKGEEVHYLLDIRSIKEVDGVPMKRNEETADGPLGTDNGGPGQETFATLETTEKEIPGNVAEAESPANAGTQKAATNPVGPISAQNPGMKPEEMKKGNVSGGSSDIGPEPNSGLQNGTAPLQNAPQTENPLSANGSEGYLPKSQDGLPDLLPTQTDNQNSLYKDTNSEKETRDENGLPFVKAANGTTVFGEIREESGLSPAPIRLSEGFQDENGKGYGLAHIEANHGKQIRNAGFSSVEDFVTYVATNYDEDNIRVGKRRYNGNTTYLLQVTDAHDNTLFIELSKDGTYWNVNSAGIFRKGYSNKKETVVKTEPRQPNNAVSTGSSLSEAGQEGITSSEPNGKPTVSYSKNTNSVPPKQEIPQKKNGTTDYAAMEPDAMFRAIAEDFGEDVALEEVARQINIYEDKIKKLSASRSEDINVRLANRNKIKELQAKTDALRDAAGIFADADIADASQSEAVTGKRTTLREQSRALGDYLSAEDKILRDIAEGLKFRWSDNGTQRGLGTELGFSDSPAERKTRFNILSNDGTTVDRYAESLEHDMDNGIIPMALNTDLRSAILDVLGRVRSNREAFDAAMALREDDPRSSMTEEEARQQAEYNVSRSSAVPEAQQKQTALAESTTEQTESQLEHETGQDTQVPDFPFRRSEAEEEAIWLDFSPEHRQAVEEIVAELNQELGENVVVFAELEELPEKVRDDVRKTMEDGYIVQGLTFNQVCYLYAPAITDKQTADYVYTHELAGHKNVEAVFPDRTSFAAFCDRLVDDIGVSEMAENIDDTGFIDCVNVYFAKPDARNKYALGREYIAYLTENSNARDLYEADYEGDFSLPSYREFITTDTLNDLIHYANSRQGRGVSQGQGRMGEQTETETGYRRADGTAGLGASNADRLSRGGQTADSGRSRPDGVPGSGTDHALPNAVGNIPGRASADEGGNGSVGSRGTGAEEHQGSVSGQDDTRVDRNQQGTLPAGETVADEAGTATGNDNIRFRRTKQPQEAANSLIAVHNTTEEQLKKSLELGGFPMPSIAITRAEMGHTDFGEISLLFDRNSIDPSDRRNRVYGGDAWTPTFPQLGVKIDPKALEAARKNIRSLLGDKLADMYKVATDLDPFNVEVEFERNNGEVRDAFARKEWMKHAYLKSKGEDFVGGWQDLHDKVPDDDQDYRKWVADVFNGLVEKIGIRNGKDMFTPTGNRRKWETLHDEVTLDNVVKAMKKQAAKGGESIFGGDIFGSAQSEYKSLAEIRKKAGERLRETTEEEQRQAREAINDLLSDINILTPDKGLGAAIDMVSNITEAVKHAHTAKDIHAYLKEIYPEMTMEVAEEIADIVGDIQAMGTRYFEAKPYRAIGFDEVRLAVVPADTDAELVRQLERRRIPVQTYERGNEEQRRMIVADATEALDIRFRRAYHGSGADFDRFDHSFMGTGEGAQDYGWGTYVTEVGGIARSYAETGTGQDHNTIKDARLRNLYTVEIPDDTGTNYIRWDGPADAVDKKEIAEKLTSEVAKDLKDDAETETAAQDIRESLNEARTGGELYGAVCFYLGNEDASRFLSSLGFAGIEYPAGYTTDERVDGAKNYVIFNAEDVKITDHVRFRNMAEANAAALSPEQVNERFNKELRRLTPENAQSSILWLGMPSNALQAAGIRNAPIKLYGNKLLKKMNKHGFKLEELKDLPQAVANPIFVFAGNRAGSYAVLTELKTEQGNVLTAIDVDKNGEADVNIVSSVFGKDDNEVLRWIDTGKLRWVDKEKARSYISAPALSAGATYNAEAISSVANIIKNFANPTRRDGEKRAEEEQVNERFNAELRRQIDGTLPKGHIYRLGRPGEALRAAGVPDLPIELSAARLAEKASPDYTNHHPFALEEVENLPQAMQHPVAIFDSKTQPGSKVVLTELQHNGTNFVVAIKAATKKTAGRRVIEINSIRSVYPKDYVQDIVNWINREDLLRWADKEKLLSFLDQQRNDYADAAFILPDKPAKQEKTEAPIEQAPNRLGKQQSNSADVAIPVEGLSVATNIIKNLANPSLAEGKKYAAAQNMADELGVKVRIVRSRDEISGEENRFRDKRGASGWHDRRTGEIAVVLPNCRDAAEVQKTILHEAVGHYGIPELLGRERADELYRRVFDAVKDTPRAQELLAEYSGDKTVAGDEYLAEMAEGDVAPSVWKRIMAAIRGFFRDSLGIDLRLTDADMRYIIWRSRNNLERARTVGEAMETIGQDIRMRAQTEREAARERKAEQLEKLRQSEPLRFTGEEYKGLYELNPQSATRYMLDNIRGEYVNADSGEKIQISRKGAKKTTGHDLDRKVHLQSVAYIPQMLENAILIDEMPNVKSSTGFDSYQYYVCGLNIGGTDYTAKVVVGVSDRTLFYDHALTEIEKGKLIEGMGSLRRERTDEKSPDFSIVKDKRLLSILQPEPLKYSQESAKNTRPEPQTPMQYIDRVARTAELHDEARWNKVWKDAEIENTDSEIDNTVRFRKRKTEAKHANDAQQADTGLRAKLKKAFGSEIPQNPNDPTLTTKRNVQTRIARKLQDETLSVRHLQEFVKKNGGTADITTDAHTALNREKGRVQAKIARAERELFEPLDKAIGEIIRSTDKEGEVPLTFDDVDNYAAAKAALERHASGTTALSENPLDPWNREYVEAVVKDFEERIPAQMIDEFWQRIAAIAAAQRRSARDYGLISAQKFREMEARGWKYYVPLQGLDAEFEGITSPRELFGRALDGNPKLKREAEALFKRAQGRTTKPKDVIATLRTNFCTTIALGERNTARQFLLRLVEQNPELQGDTRAAVGAERQNRTEDRAAALERVNDAFNRRLEKLTPENADSTILYIGKPSPALRAAGMEDRNIALYGNKLIKKAKQHGYSMHDVKNLPKYITEPIAVFKGSYTDGYAILTEMRINGENTLVSIDVRKGVVQDLNLVTSVFGKNSKGVVDWINKGKTLWANKKKALDYLSSSALNADATSNQGISSATNIIENFENPPIPEPEKRRGGIFEIEEVWYLRRDPTRMTDREKEAGEYFEQTTKTPERDEIERSERAAAQRDELQRELEETVRRIDGREAQKNPDLLEKLLEKRRELNERIEALFDEITAVRQLPWGARYAGESQAEEREHYVSVMRHGARVNIRFSDPTVAQAVNAHAEELFGGVFGRAVEWTARRTRFLASMSTQWNPEFLLPNHVRDLIWAGVSHAVDADGNFRGYLHALPKAYGAVARHNREGKAQPMTLNERAMYNIYTPEGFAAACGALGEKRVFDTLYEDFVENRGLTGYAHMQNPQELARKIKKRTKAGYTRGAQAARTVRDGMRLLGDVSEITTRFATFAAQVGAGRDVLSAVNYAKNVTVNFNTRGEWGRGLNALFMFFNAGAQGINNVWQLAKRNPKRAPIVMAVAAAMGYAAMTLMDWALAAGAADDDEGERWWITDYERYVNLILPLRLLGWDDGYVKIPIPVELRPFWLAGVLARDVAAGRENAAKAAEKLVSALSQAFVPIDISVEHPWRAMVPSVVKPVFELTVWNEDFTGRKINRVPYPGETVPDSQLERRNAHIAAKWFSEFLASLGGGDETTPAGMYLDEEGNLRKNRIVNMLDVSPSTIEHLVTSYGGGVARFVLRTLDFILKRGEEREVRNWPVLNRFVGEARKGIDENTRYYDIRTQYNERWALLNKNLKRMKIPPYYGSPEEAVADAEWIRTVRGKIAETEKLAKALMEQREFYERSSKEYTTFTKAMNEARAAFVEWYDRATGGEPEPEAEAETGTYDND